MGQKSSLLQHYDINPFSEILLGNGGTPFAYLMSSYFGPYGRSVTAAIAVVAIFSAKNSYTASLSRAISAVSKSHGLPSLFSRVHQRARVPYRAIMLMSTSTLIVLVVYYFLVDLVGAFLMVSGVAGIVYIVGSTSATSLLREKGPKEGIATNITGRIDCHQYLLAAGAVIIILSLLYTRKYGKVKSGKIQGAEV